MDLHFPLEETTEFQLACTETINCIQKALSALKEDKNAPVFLALLQAHTLNYQELWKSYSATLVRLSKQLEKNYRLDALPVLCDSKDFESACEPAIHRAIAEYFFRKGESSLGESCQCEFNVQTTETTESANSASALFGQLNEIVQQILHLQSIDLALAWTCGKANMHNLVFALREFEFVCMMHAVPDPNLGWESKRMQLIEYARTHLAPLAVASAASAPDQQEMLQRIQRLMTCILWHTKVPAAAAASSSSSSKSPYAALEQCKSLQRLLVVQFTQTFCRVHGMNANSALEVVLQVASAAIPKLSKALALIRDKRMEWTQQGELPIEIPVPEECKNYHSVFICPVLKVQTSKENPPMCLGCGHVICKEALAKLSRSHSNS